MKTYEQVELLRGMLAVAVADGVITPSERSLYERLANQAGVGKLSLEAMVARFENDPEAWKQERFGVMSAPERAVELLVATAQIDGKIVPEEKEVLVGLAKRLGVSRKQFAEAVRRGIRKADAARGKGE